MYKESIGLIETVGLTTAVVVADVAVKSANVELIGYELTKGSGMVTVKISGDVGSVNAAVDACIGAADTGKIFSTKVIARLGENVEKLIFTDDTVGYEKIAEKSKEPEKIINNEPQIAETTESPKSEITEMPKEELTEMPKLDTTEKPKTTELNKTIKPQPKSKTAIKK